MGNHSCGREGLIMSSITIPEDYSLVLAAGAFTGLSLLITTTLAGLKRKEAGVKFPNLYASDKTCEEDPKARAFNCAQRGAMNPHESHTAILFGLIVGGLTYPRVAAGAGFVWSLGALLYYKGYASGDPKKRYSYGGGIMRLAGAVLVILPFITAYKAYQ